MSHLQSWADFLKKQAQAPPLLFVSGVRHPVSVDVISALHSHPSMEIVYHPIGYGTTMVHRDPPIPFCEGSAVIYVPCEPHDQIVDKDGEDHCVRIAVPPTSDPLPQSCLYVPRVENASVREDMLLLSRGQPRLSPVEKAIFNLRATAVLLGLIQIACDYRHQEEADLAEQHLLKAEQYIREYYASIGSLADVARHVGVSQDYLRHIFKLRRGKPLVRHLSEVRIDRARNLLRHSQLPMKQIASLCGFKDEYYFSAVFRRLALTSPGAYRQAAA